MTNDFERKDRPERASDGRFKKGHIKRGGRKRGAPNLFTPDYRKAILEAAYRIGYDGNGKDGVLGYMRWLCERHPEVCGLKLLAKLLEWDANTMATEPSSYGNELDGEPRRTARELDEYFRNYIGLTKKNRTKKQNIQIDPNAPWSWTGQDWPVGPLMQWAVEKPKIFCKLIADAFLRPPTKRRRPRPNKPL